MKSVLKSWEQDANCGFCDRATTWAAGPWYNQLFFTLLLIDRCLDQPSPPTLSSSFAPGYRTRPVMMLSCQRVLSKEIKNMGEFLGINEGNFNRRQKENRKSQEGDFGLRKRKRKQIQVKRSSQGFSPQEMCQWDWKGPVCMHWGGMHWTSSLAFIVQKDHFSASAFGRQKSQRPDSIFHSLRSKQQMFNDYCVLNTVLGACGKSVDEDPSLWNLFLSWGRKTSKINTWISKL